MIYHTNRMDAAKAGQTRFRKLKPCRNGHTVKERGKTLPALSITISGRCTMCHADNQRNSRDRVRALLAKPLIKSII